jgi:phosphatidylglycerophosphatase A
VKQFAAEIIATFFYVGKIPKAPGTFGSLAAIPLAWYLWKLPFAWVWFSIFVIFLLGTWASSVLIQRTGTEDHQSIVIDEVVGIFVTTSVAGHLWWHYLLAFCFFRIFDILKPGPVRYLDKKIKGGFGTMIDDFAAAILAALLLYIVLTATQPWLNTIST